MITLEEGRNKHLTKIVSNILSGENDAALQSNLNELVNSNKYDRGVRFYYDIDKEKFVGKPNAGFTFLRGVIPLNTPPTLNTFKATIEEAIRKYNDLFMLSVSENQSTSYLSSGMLCYLDFPQSVIDNLFKNKYETMFSKDFQAFYFKESGIELDEDEFFDSSFVIASLDIIDKFFDYKSFCSSFREDIKSGLNNIDELWAVKLKFYMRVIYSENNYDAINELVNVFNGLVLTDYIYDSSLLNGVLAILSNKLVGNGFILNVETNKSITTRVNNIKVIYNSEGYIKEDTLSQAVYYSKGNVSIPKNLHKLLKARILLNKVIGSFLRTDRAYYDGYSDIEFKPHDIKDKKDSFLQIFIEKEKTVSLCA